MFNTRSEAALSSSWSPSCPYLPFATLAFSQSSLRHRGFASLTLNIPGQASVGKGGLGGNGVREAATGQEFSGEFCTRGTINCSRLVGLGVRARRILGMKNINGGETFTLSPQKSAG